jgi:hypothetical protein
MDGRVYAFCSAHLFLTETSFIYWY